MNRRKWRETRSRSSRPQAPLVRRRLHGRLISPGPSTILVPQLRNAVWHRSPITPPSTTSNTRGGTDAEVQISSHINNDVVLRLGAADQHIAFRRRLDRFGLIASGPTDKPGLTSVADTRPARPSRRYVARFGEFKQALEAWAPTDIETASGKGDERTAPRSSVRRVRRPTRRGADTRGSGRA